MKYTKPERVQLPIPNHGTVEVADDAYSDRVRCDHPDCSDGAALGSALQDFARQRGRGRVVLLARSGLETGLRASGFRTEAVMPGFYAGQDDCAVMAGLLSPARGDLADPFGVERAKTIVAAKAGKPSRPMAATRRATEADAEDIARLIGATFDHYPTPSDDPAYIADDIRDGTPYRVGEDDGVVVACASADLVRAARTAELTDCATRPDQRGRGWMQALLAGLMDDLRAMDYPTAFTLSRAKEIGINLAFQRLSFTFRGCMTSSCRIGTGLEDMNVWSRALA